MTIKPKSSRRKFLKQSSLLFLGSLPAGGVSNSIWSKPNIRPLQLFVFSKHLQFLDYADMCLAVKDMGFDGIDITVRPGGHVEPERVAQDLPRATQAMLANGLSPVMATTKVMDAQNPTDLAVLTALSANGYKFYRPGWFRYKKEGDVLQTVQEAQSQLTALADLNQELGVSGSYQNHSGHYLGSALWDLDKSLGNLLPKFMGCQYDISHATIEAGKSWEIGFRLIKQRINTLVVKDFIWTKQDGRWNRAWVPLGAGMVDFKRYFALLKKFDINVPLSIHYEYDLGGAEHGGQPGINHKEVFRRMQKDLQFVRRIWAAV